MDAVLIIFYIIGGLIGIAFFGNVIIDFYELCKEDGWKTVVKNTGRVIFLGFVMPGAVLVGWAKAGWIVGLTIAIGNAWLLYLVAKHDK